MNNYDKYLEKAIENAKRKIAELKGSSATAKSRHLSELYWNKRIKELQAEQQRLCQPEDNGVYN